MNQFNDISWQVGHFLEPLVAVVIAVTFGAFLYQFSLGVATWARLKLSGYSEREEVYLNGTRAVITKIGFGSVTFLILNGDGAIMKWAAVSNRAMDSQRIERVSLKLKKLEELGGHEPSHT
ncbi:MAG: hypothetical protein F4145_16700 [Boseongicola sp. SB0675_bin_26]|nr:hypothetical protein [Boseongicola sp. SB0675_bin_26]